MPQDSIYPNAPLVEAVFEIRFPGEPAVECHRDLFFQQIRSLYSRVWVPNLREGQAPSLAPYHFKTDDDASSVLTAINLFGFSTRRYQGFISFKEEALRLIRQFGELYNIGKLNRTGLRYVNALRFIPEDQGLPLSDHLSLSLKLPDVFPSNFKNLELAFVSNVGGGSITTRISNVTAKDGSGEVILLDFDFAKEKDLHISQVEEYLDESHSHTKTFFESVLTDSYLRYIKGEVL